MISKGFGDPALISKGKKIYSSCMKNIEDADVVIKGLIIGTSSKAQRYNPKQSEGVIITDLHPPGDAYMLQST